MRSRLIFGAGNAAGPYVCELPPELPITFTVRVHVEPECAGCRVWTEAALARGDFANPDDATAAFGEVMA